MASVLDSDPYLAVLREALERVQLVRYEGLQRPTASRSRRHHQARKKERSARQTKSVHEQEAVYLKHLTNPTTMGAEAVDVGVTRAHAVVDLLGEPEPWPCLDPQRFRLYRVVDGRVVSCVKDQTDASNPYFSSARHLQSQQHRLQNSDRQDRSGTTADTADTKNEFVPPFAEDLRRADDPRNINGLLRSFDEVCRRLTRYAQYKHLQVEADKERGAVNLKTNAPSRSIMAQTHSSQVKTLFENSSAPMVLVASLRGFDVGHAPTPLSHGKKHKKQNSLFAAFKHHRQTFNTPFLKASGDTRIGFTTSKLNIPRSLRAADPQFPSTAQEIMRYLIKNNIHMQSLLMDCFWIFYLEFFALSSLSVRYLRFRKLIREEHDALERSAAVRQELGMPTDGGRAHRFQRERATEQIRKRLHEYGSGLVTADFLSEQRLVDYNTILNAIKRPDDIEYVDLATLVSGGGGGETNKGAGSGGANSGVDTDVASRIGMAKISVSRSLAKDIVAKATRKPRPEELMTVRGAFLGDGYINETRGLELVAGGGGVKGGSSSGSMPIATLSRARRMVPFHLLTHSQLINATLPSGADAVATTTNSTAAEPHQQRSPTVGSARATHSSSCESARNPQPRAGLAEVHRAPKPPFPRLGGLPAPRCHAHEISFEVEVNTLVEAPRPATASNIVPHALSPAAVSYADSEGFESEANGITSTTLGAHLKGLRAGDQHFSSRPQSSPKVPVRFVSVAPSTPAPLRPQAVTTTMERRPLFTPHTPDKNKSMQKKRHNEGVMVEVRVRAALPIITANSPRVRGEESTFTCNTEEPRHPPESTPLTRLLTPWSGSRQQQSQGLVESPSVKEKQPLRPSNSFVYKNVTRGSSATARPHTSPAIGFPASLKGTPLSARARNASDSSPKPPTAPKPSPHRLQSATISPSRHDDSVDDKGLHDGGGGIKEDEGHRRPATAAKAHEGNPTRHQAAPTPLYSPRTFQRTAATDSAFPAPEDYHTKHYFVEMRKRATGLDERSTTDGHCRGSGRGPTDTVEDPSVNPRVIVVQNVPERDDRSGEWRNRQIATPLSSPSHTHEGRRNVPLLTSRDYTVGTIMMIESQKEENGTGRSNLVTYDPSASSVNSSALAVVSDQTVDKDKEQQRAPCIIQTNYCSEVDPSQCLRVLRDEFYSTTKSNDENGNEEKNSAAVAIEARGKEGAEVGSNAVGHNGSPFFSIGRNGRAGIGNANPALAIANTVIPKTTSGAAEKKLVDNPYAHHTGTIILENKNNVAISNSRRTSNTSSKGQLSSKELAESIIAEIRGPKIEVCPHHEIEARGLEVKTNELRDKIVAAHEGGDLVDLEITSSSCPPAAFCENNDDGGVSSSPLDDQNVGGDVVVNDATARVALDVPQLTALAIEVVREEQDMLFSRISHHLQRLFAFGRFAVARNIRDGVGVKGKERHDYHHGDANDDNDDGNFYNNKMGRKVRDGPKDSSSTANSSSELSESDGWSDLLNEILEEENGGCSNDDEERDRGKEESEEGEQSKKLSFSSNESHTGDAGVGGDDGSVPRTNLRMRQGPLTIAILRRSEAIERAKEARHAAKERRLAAISEGKRRPHSASPSSTSPPPPTTFTSPSSSGAEVLGNVGTEDEVSINASPALREVKAQLLSPLPDVIAHMVWLELRHWMPYAEDLLGNSQRAEIKRMLSVWIHGIENTQTSHWDVDESDLAEAKQKLSRLREMRREASKAFGGRASSTATALQFMFSHATTAVGATTTSSSSNKPKREEESPIADYEKKDPKKELRRGFVMGNDTTVEEEVVTAQQRGRKKREIPRGLAQDKLEPAEVDEKAPARTAEALQPSESVGGLGGVEGTLPLPPPPILFKLFDDGDNLPPPPTAEQKAAMLKHKVIDPVCAVSCDHTLRELNAMRLGEGGAAEIEELAREEEAERQRKARLRARYRQAALQQQALNRGRSSSSGAVGSRRSSSSLAAAAQQNNGPDAKEILRLHRFSPANRAPRQWHERGKKPTHDLGAIMKAAPLLSSAAPAFFDVRQTSPLMRRFLTDGNAELPNTKRSNTLAWSQ